MRTSIHQKIIELHSFLLGALDPTQLCIWRVYSLLELFALNHSNNHASCMDRVEADIFFSKVKHHVISLLVDWTQFDTYLSDALFRESLQDALFRDN
jgi:hypothetical protein